MNSLFAFLIEEIGQVSKHYKEHTTLKGKATIII